MIEKLALFGGKPVRIKPFPSHPVIGNEEKQAASKVLQSGLLSGFIAAAGDSFLGGPEVREFETKFAEYFHVKYAIALNSATAGLHAAIAAAGIGPGDEVIVSPCTMTASASCILMQNAIPVFADIEDQTFCLDPDKVQKAITSRTKAIIVVHLFGHPANMNALLTIAADNNLALIEDCAQAPGAIYQGRYVGTIGDTGIFSLTQSKTITSGEGGVVITDNREFAKKIQLVRNHGEVVVSDSDQGDIVNVLGWNYRMTEIEAAIGLVQFKKLEFLTQWRQELAEFLTRELSQFSGIITPKTRPGSQHVYFSYPIRFLEARIGISRDFFVKAIDAEGISIAGGYVKPIYLQPIYQKQICYGKYGCPFTCSYYGGKTQYYKGLCPISERLFEKELITMNACRFPATKQDIKDIIKAFGKVFDNIKKLKDFTTTIRNENREWGKFRNNEEHQD